MKRRGFTLIELLVVIAVIAILAAMLAPVMMQAKENSKMRVCVSNIRQMGFAINNYIDDNNGLSLPQNTPLASSNPWVLCVEPLIPAYIPGSKLMLKNEIVSPSNNVCPPQPKRIWICSGDIYRGPSLTDQPYWWNKGSSYMYPGSQAYLFTSGSKLYDKDGLRPLKPYNWLNPKRDILISDFWYDFHSGGRRVAHEMMEDTNILPSACASWQDVKCINAMFLDLHVKTLTPKERLEYREYLIKPPPDGDNPYK